MKAKEYQIAGKTLVMKKFTVGDWKVVADIMAGLEISEATQVGDVIDYLIHAHLGRIMEVIFGMPAIDVEWPNVEYDVIDEVVTDFLSLNPRLKMRLGQLSATLLANGARVIPAAR